MSITLNKFLKSKGYSSVKLIFLVTKHYLIEAKVNGIDGTFILDTGASNSCICTSLEDKFKVISKESKEKASSANSEMTNTKISKSNIIQIGKWEEKINLITFDMSHINTALSEKKINPIDGIIGADVLKKSKAVIDYESNKLYLKIKI
jgi:predicted aspartyl protease